MGQPTDDIETLLLQLRHPAAGIRDDAHVAYWLLARGQRADMHLSEIIDHFDALAALIEPLRARVAEAA